MIRHPSLSLLSTAFSREDLFLVVYCVVDDWMHARFGSANAPRARRGPGLLGLVARGPAPDQEERREEQRRDGADR